MEYCEYLKTHLKEKQAMGLLQEMFELAEDYNDISLVSSKIIELNANDNNTRTEYEQCLSNNNYFKVYGDDLRKEIQKIAQPSLNSSVK